MGSDLEREIRQPWREVRRKIGGSEDGPLHAAKFARAATEDQIRTVADFFRTQRFGRLGAIIPKNAPSESDVAPMWTVANLLKRRIFEVAKWLSFEEVAIFFESSDRADRLIEREFGDFGLEVDGRPVPVKCYFMPKSANEPAMEVADFVVHAVGRQTRRKLEGKEGFAPDFEAVFRSVDRRMVSFLEVSSVVRNPDSRT
jgi:hypothetical protein